MSITLDLNKSRPKADLLSNSSEEAFEEITDNKSGKRIELLKPLDIQLFRDEHGSAQPDAIQEEKVQAIMASAEDIGILQICIVRLMPDGKMQLLCGRHRREAAIRLRLLLPCEILENISDRRAYEIMAESNPPGREKFPSELGKIFARYLEWRSDAASEEDTAEKVAIKFGVSKRTVYRYANVVNLTPSICSLIDSKKITVKLIEKLAALDPEQQESIAEYFDNFGKLSTSALSDIIDYMNNCRIESISKAIAKLEEENRFAKPVKNEAQLLNRIRSSYPQLSQQGDEDMYQYILSLICRDMGS